MKYPIFVFSGIRITRRRPNDCNFLRRKDTLTEGIFAIALFQTPTFLCRKTDEKSGAVKTKNWGEALALRPFPTLTIAQNDDPRFSSKGHEVLILLDGQDTHRRDGLWGTFLSQGSVLTQCKTFKSAKILDTVLIFIVALKPDVTIRMSCGKGLKEGRRAISMEIDSAGNVCHGIKRRPRQTRPRRNRIRRTANK